MISNYFDINFTKYYKKYKHEMKVSTNDQKEQEKGVRFVLYLDQL